MTDVWFSRLVASGQSLLGDLIEQGAELADLAGGYASPIERAMAVAMCVLCGVRYPEFEFCPEPGLSLQEAQARLASFGLKTRWGIVFPQVVVDDYRVDFLILHSKGLKGTGGIVVECDGHVFHEKTKNQAARDKARDRALQERGFKVLRFTGSEIWKDAIGCADEAIGAAFSIAQDAELARKCMQQGNVNGALRALHWVS
jgi:Uncharacterized protein conserved in bacteria